ncbi:hypothetical protein FB45DRAFT_1009906 [Roridomyces roridus]|uniref:F-box domain-containing protein n=1 Tax=Roridomyces roridus TaxID=1738132 RepID=A0AAD7FC79_9AGAR|nr:hypothetical protein FB45DRAFT_1009906 [Roridomyces roridus]
MAIASMRDSASSDERTWNALSVPHYGSPAAFMSPRTRNSNILISIRGTIATIHALPFELLSKIMVLALYSQYHDTSCSDVFYLCAVCSRWRDVAIPTPLLWAQVALPLTLHGGASSITNLFLERSALRPVHINVGNAFWDPKKPADFRPALASVGGAADRWESLAVWRIDFPQADSDIIDPLTYVPAGRLASLKKLSLTLLNREIVDHPNQAVFISAPYLCDVTLDMRDAFEIIPMPWEQLTRLEVKCSSPQACLDALVQCVNVVAAKVSTEQWLSGVAAKPATNLVKMETLEIRVVGEEWDAEDFGPFLRQLNLPELKSLSLDCLSFEDRASPLLSTALQIFLAEGSPKLEQLALRDCISPSDIPQLLAHTPSLVRFRFQDGQLYSIDDEFFDVLQYSSTDQTRQLVPKLERLEIAELYPTFTELAVVNLVQSRKACVKLEWSEELEWSETYQFEEFREILEVEVDVDYSNSAGGVDMVILRPKDMKGN